MRVILILAALLFCPLALAQDSPVFDIEKLCKWQSDNNGMDIAECAAIEREGKTFVEANVFARDAKRVEECKKEVLAFAADSGVASYAIYAGCLKDGPDSLNVAPSP